MSSANLDLVQSICVRAGKVTRLVWYWDRERAFADLGLPSKVGSQRSWATVALRRALTNRDTSSVSSANLELVRSLYEEWARGDFSSVEWAHPEIEFAIADGPSAGRWTGLAGLAEGYREWLAGWEEIRVMADDYYELDEERILVLVRGSGHGRTSGLKMEQIATGHGANLFHVRDGRVTRLVRYYDGERALADFGLPSEADSREERRNTASDHGAGKRGAGAGDLRSLE